MKRLMKEMCNDENVLIMGEDVGKGHGCYKVTNGLYEKYGGGPRG